VDIPPALVEFLRRVAQLIDDSDESTTIESDDFLQCDCVYGGLSDPEAKRFGFRYFHGEDATWDVVLDASQIADIADGLLKQLALWRCSGGSCECLYATEDSYCTHCDSIRHFDDDYPSSLRLWYPDEPPDAISSLANLRRIALAICDYVRENDGRMPPPFTTDAAGNRLHSWRSLILPFLDLDELYAAIDLQQPWNASVNRAVAARTPDVFSSPDTASGHTRYSAIVGPDTLWPPNTTRMLSDVTSGYSFTIAVVESPCSEFEWMAPDDSDIDALAQQLGSRRRSLLAAWIDGNVTALTDLNVDRLRELARI
jgi:hypothetical protein